MFRGILGILSTLDLTSESSSNQLVWSRDSTRMSPFHIASSLRQEHAQMVENLTMPSYHANPMAVFTSSFSTNQGHSVRRVNQAGGRVTQPLPGDGSTLHFSPYSKNEDSWSAWKNIMLAVLSKLAQDIDKRQIQIVNLASCRIQIRQPHIMGAFFSQIAVHSYFAPARNHRKHPRLHLYPFFHATPAKQQRLATKQIWMAWTQQAYCIYCNTETHLFSSSQRSSKLVL